MQQSLFISEPSGQKKGPAESFDRSELNEAQLAAATSMGAPILVIAGAGTGKTRTLVYRMAYLIEQGVSADNILLLTFTRKAAQEMTDRAGRLIRFSWPEVESWLRANGVSEEQSDPKADLGIEHDGGGA